MVGVAAAAAAVQAGLAAVLRIHTEGLDSQSSTCTFVPGAKTTIYEVSDPLQLPFAVQCMVDKTGVSAVVAIGFLVADAHWCSKEVR